MGQKLTHTIRIPTLDIHLEQSALAQLAFPCALKKKKTGDAECGMRLQQLLIALYVSAKSKMTQIPTEKTK